MRLDPFHGFIRGRTLFLRLLGSVCKDKVMQKGPGDQEKAGSILRVPEFIFVNWREVLNQVPLSVMARRTYVQAIETYLDYCRNNTVTVGKESARGFMDDAVRRGLTREPEAWKEAIRWYFRDGFKRGRPHPPGVPSLGQADTGRAHWEARMIERLRLKKYSWRTEQTYREWAGRLAVFIGRLSIPFILSSCHPVRH